MRNYRTLLTFLVILNCVVITGLYSSDFQKSTEQLQASKALWLVRFVSFSFNLILKFYYFLERIPEPKLGYFVQEQKNSFILAPSG